jgi:predicted PurR-regulated permease PerM
MNMDNHWSLPLRYLVLGLAFLLLAIVLWYIRSVLEPLIIAAFVAYLINPAVNFLAARRRISRKVSVNLVYFITLAVLVGTPATLTSLLFDEFTQVIKDVLNQFDYLIVLLQKPLPIPGISANFGQLANQLTQFRSTFLTSLPDQALKSLGKTSLGALWVVVILVAVYYFLAEWPRLRDGFIGSFHEKYAPEINELYQRVRKIWMNYLRGFQHRLDNYWHSRSVGAGHYCWFPDLDPGRRPVPVCHVGGWRGAARRFQLELDAILPSFGRVDYFGSLFSADFH